MFSYFCGFVLLALLSYVKFSDSYVAMSELTPHRFYVYNRSPKDVYIYKMRHVIVHDRWEEFQDVYRGIDIPANDSSTNFQMHIRHSETCEDWDDWWVMIYYYDNKNYTARKPFYCRVYQEDTKAPIQLIVDFTDLQLHVVPPVSKNCTTKIYYVPDKPDYIYDDYPRFPWMSTDHSPLWWW